MMPETAFEEHIGLDTTLQVVEHAGAPVLRIIGVVPEGFHGQAVDGACLCPLDAQNAAALRRHVPWTAPQLVGLRKSVGCGDRLGLATPGHLRAVKSGDMFPVLAQQSIREMQRSARTPSQVLDDATWAVFESGWRSGYGCDADHVKTIEAIDACVDVGFNGFTLDPGEHVDDAAASDDLETLQVKFAALPWGPLEIAPDVFIEQYLGETPAGEASPDVLMRAACKYGRAVAHVVTLTRRIAERMAGKTFDLEISVDETATPTTPLEHYLIASELQRLNVPFTGLAPRFVGRFEKGVDYLGDHTLFEADFAQHARLARELGPYKLSIHSGSDKFGIYPIIARHANPYVHLKTAGTSWLEAVRVIAAADPALMREMLACAIEH